MADEFEAIGPVAFPELVIGLAGPIGVNLDLLTEKLTEQLKSVRYNAIPIHLTKAMEDFIVVEKKSNSFEEYHRKMDSGNELRAKWEDPAAMAIVAVDAIRKERQKISGSEDKTAISTAYIIRQIKLPEEVQLLRQIYGPQFLLISAYAPSSKRSDLLFSKIKSKIETTTPDDEIRSKANNLIARDESESDQYKDTGKLFGQNLRETFHLADAFIDGIDNGPMEEMLERFIAAFFGRNDISPSKTEYGMYAAKAASLRSADLSRQVGAAIFSGEGELIVQGCNEVPKAHGGTYWDSEDPDNRDIKKGVDPNEKLKMHIIRNVVELLNSGDYLSDKATKIGSNDSIVKALTEKGSTEAVLSNSLIMDLTEYGRIVHAEMCALCDAARTGRSIKGATLFCTTFPCHNCTKHILASGIKKVVFMEPYPKSRAEELHADEIEIESDNDPKKVSFVPFMGVSPFRYRDIFQKRKRKKSDGTVDPWQYGQPQPCINVGFPSYPNDSEIWVMQRIIGEVKAKSNATEDAEAAKEDTP